MGFRDDNEALRAKVRALEEEVEVLRGELAERDEPASDEPAEEPAERAADVHSERAESIRGLVAAREERERRDRSDKASTESKRRERAIRRYERRAPRVRVERDGVAVRRIVIGPELLRDKLRDQLPWGVGFAFFNPGVFVMLGTGFALRGLSELSIGWTVALTILGWALLLGAINVGWALSRRRGYVVDLTEDGYFAVYRFRRRRPTLLGRREQLKHRNDEPDPARLGGALLTDGREHVRIDRLTAADLRAFAQALGDRRG